MRRFVLTADLGGTKIAVARVDNTGRITHRLLAPTPPAGGTAVVDAITSLLEQLPLKDAVALGVDVPGLVHSSGIVWAPNIRGWEHMPLGRVLSRRLNLPALIESDRNAFVIGETWQGCAKKCQDVVFVSIGTGIGAGIISGGRLIRGHGELAGCLGWMAVRDRFHPLYKTLGCLESHVAGPGIARAAQRVFRRPMDAREILTLARAADSRAIEVITQAGYYLGLALANVVDILNPRLLVIGGGVAAAGDLLLVPARNALKQWAQPLAAKQVRITRSPLGTKAGLLGVAKLCFDHLEDAKGGV